jgi:predicted HAD superfamily hydrolase
MNYNLCVKRVYQVIPATTKMQRSESVNMQKNKTKIANNSLYQPTNELELLEWSGGHKKKVTLISDNQASSLCRHTASSTRWILNVTQTAESNTQIHKKGTIIVFLYVLFREQTTSGTVPLACAW